MLTLRQLLAKYPYNKALFNERKAKVTSSITKAEVIKRNGVEGIKFHATGRASTEKVYYKIEFELYPKPISTKNGIEKFKNVDMDTHCWVKCGCPFFLFHSAWVLTSLYGSSELGDCEDRPPKITNPEMKPYVCKHVHAIAQKALKALQAQG